MSRYLRLYLYFLQFSFSKAMEFRVDFFFRVIMDLIYYAVNIFFFKVIYLHTPILGGWTEDQTMIFVASYLLVDAINMTVFSTNMWWLPFYINRGDLDYYLIRPVSPLFFLSLREFSANSFINLIMAIAILGWALIRYQAPFGVGEVVLLLVLILNGTLIHFCLQMLMVIPVFWTQSSRGFMDLFYSLGLVMERPHRIFQGWLRKLFTTLLPFALIASFPAQLFLETFHWGTFIHLAIVSCLLWVVMLFVWHRALRTYSSASS